MSDFGLLFDFNADGKVDVFEEMAGLQMMAQSRAEAIEMTGDDTFYLGSDEMDQECELEDAGLDYDELEGMDEEERCALLEDAGLDPDDFDFD